MVIQYEDLNLLEFFCGTKSISNEAEGLGMNTFTSDSNKSFKSHYTVNILNFDVSKVPFKPDIIWASPPCTAFSVASAWKHWDNKKPITLFALAAIEIVKKTLALIEYFNPKVFYIENPRGMLRHTGLLDHLIRHTVTYCQYGDTRMKPTDIWTNNTLWNPKPECKLTDICHEKDGTNKLTTAKLRAVIPPQLCREVLISAAHYISQNKILPDHCSGQNNILPGLQLI